MTRDATYEVRGAILRETDAAILVELEDGEEVWLPFSQVHEIHRDADVSTLVVSKWIARQKGLC